MRIGIFITARLGSTRLAKKHLLMVKGKPIIFYLIERIKTEFEKEINNGDVSIVITTSEENENREFENLRCLGIDVFYGCKNNIPLRHYQAAIEHKIDAIVSVDGDDILCSPKAIREVYKAFSNGSKYIKTFNLPFGMNCSGYTTQFLSLSLEGHFNDILETGWGRIFDEKELVNISIPFEFQGDFLRLTLDYEEDFHFFKAIIEKCNEDIIAMSDEEIIKTVIENELFKINEIVTRQYWENFRRVQNQEMASQIKEN